jgi:hypothetical protein
VFYLWCRSTMSRSTGHGRGAGPITSDGPSGHTNGRAGHCLAAQARDARTRNTQGTAPPGRSTAVIPSSRPTGGRRGAALAAPIRAAVSSVGAESSAISVKSHVITWRLGGGAPGAMICGISFSSEAVGGLSMAGG